VDTFLANPFEVALDMHYKEIPHADIFNLFVIDPKHKFDTDHVKDVLYYMRNLLNGDIDTVVDLPQKDKETLQRIIPSDESEKTFLLYTALYHDIGKAINKPRHGAVGSDLILRSRGPIRKQFYTLGFTRRQIYLMATIIRFHDYLAGVGTGETSYLAFAEVLYPVTNMSLIDKESCKVFFNYLLLTNLADVAGSLHRKVDMDTSMAILHDFEIITKIHESISKKISVECEEIAIKSATYDVDITCMVERNLGHIMPELQKIAEDNTIERVRRLLRTAFRGAFEDITNLQQYKNWVIANYKTGRNLPKSVDEWFVRDYKTNDVNPIVNSFRAINIKNDFYKQLAFICKLDYELGFVKSLLKSLVEEECNKDATLRKGPHNFRRDLAITLVIFLNTLVEIFGCFTQNNTRIGLGFEHMQYKESSYKNEMLRRLAGQEGIFKQTEAMTTFKHSVNVWII
jgi:hypothetical protein